MMYLSCLWLSMNVVRLVLPLEMLCVNYM